MQPQAIRNETGWVFSDNLAHKCCKEAGIKSTARRTYHHTRGRESERYPNVISGNWNATKPLEIVVSDRKNKRAESSSHFAYGPRSSLLIPSISQCSQRLYKYS